MKHIREYFPSILLLSFSILYAVYPEKHFQSGLIVSACLFIGQQILEHFKQPDLNAELAALAVNTAKNREADNELIKKQMADLRDDFAKASMILSNKAAANPSAPKTKTMVF